MNEPSITITGGTSTANSAATYVLTNYHVMTEEELKALNDQNDFLTSREVQQKVLDILDRKTLPMWMVLYLPSWLVNFLFWLKK